MSETHAVLAARELLESLTPLKTDCGRLCGGACCQGDEQTGMLLFPGEDALYAECGFARVLDADFSLGSESARLLVCHGTCPRAERPLACRLFPLFLRFNAQGGTRVVLDPRARAVCPLTDYGLEALDGVFVAAAREAYALLMESDRCATYLRELDEVYRL